MESPPNSTGRKKAIKRALSPSSSEDESPSPPWPHFLVMSSTDDNFKRLSPFAIQKGIQGIAGTPKSVKKLRSGDLLIEVEKKSHSDNLLKARSLANIAVTTSPHRILNSSRGIVRDTNGDLSFMSEAEIVEELSDQGVVAVRRFTVLRDGHRKPTRTYLMTFNSAVRPETIHAGYLLLRVSPFIPNPLRCFKCQQYGHHREACKNAEICHKCSEVQHEGDCEKPLKCRNCNGAHSASSKDCPKWILEKEVQKIKTTLGVSFQEARAKVEQSRKPSQSYSAAVKQRKEVAVQCSLVQLPSLVLFQCSSTTGTSQTTPTRVSSSCQANISNQKTTRPKSSTPVSAPRGPTKTPGCSTQEKMEVSECPPDNKKTTHVSSSSSGRSNATAGPTKPRSRSLNQERMDTSNQNSSDSKSIKSSKSPSQKNPPQPKSVVSAPLPSEKKKTKNK